MKKPIALVIDDDPTLGEIFSMALTMLGLETETVQDGRLAIERIAARQADLITLDMDMPFVSGVDILRQLRADDRFAGLRVMLVTGNARAAEQEDIHELADVILIKPVMFHQIKEFAERMLQSPKPALK